MHYHTANKHLKNVGRVKQVLGEIEYSAVVSKDYGILRVVREMLEQADKLKEKLLQHDYECQSKGKEDGSA